LYTDEENEKRKEKTRKAKKNVIVIQWLAAVTRDWVSPKIANDFGYAFHEN